MTGKGSLFDETVIKAVCKVTPESQSPVLSMRAQVHDIYQTNPADLIRIYLGILCFNTVNHTVDKIGGTMATCE